LKKKKKVSCKKVLTLLLIMPIGVCGNTDEAGNVDSEYAVMAVG